MGIKKNKEGNLTKERRSRKETVRGRLKRERLSGALRGKSERDGASERERERERTIVSLETPGYRSCSGASPCSPHERNSFLFLDDEVHGNRFQVCRDKAKLHQGFPFQSANVEPKNLSSNLLNFKR